MNASNSYTYEYFVKAITPNPKKPGNFLIYNGPVIRENELNQGIEFDTLLSGLSNHFSTHYGEPIKLDDINLLSCTLTDTTEPMLHAVLHPTDVLNEGSPTKVCLVAKDNEFKEPKQAEKSYLTEAEELEAGKQDFLKALPIIVGVSILASILIPNIAKLVR